MVDTKTFVEYCGVKYEQFYGSPFDRGRADSYYHRGENPHWYPNGSTDPRLSIDHMTDAEVQAYRAGYAYNEELGDKKQWY